MTIRFKLQTKRTISTFLFSVLIFILYKFNFEYSVAVIAGLILGGIQGAGSAGLFLIFIAIKNGMEDFNVFSGAILFFASALSGIIAGHPKEKIGKKEPLKITAASVLSMGLSAYGLYIKDSQVFSANILIFVTQTGICILSALLFRPIAAKILYPENKLKDEFNDLISIKNKEEKK